jgi:hypothetical protein
MRLLNCECHCRHAQRGSVLDSSGQLSAATAANVKPKSWNNRPNAGLRCRASFTVTAAGAAALPGGGTATRSAEAVRLADDHAGSAPGEGHTAPPDER